MKYEVIQGNNLDTLKNYPDNHFDSIVTDPPYGISFLGKDWDAHTGEVMLYKECLRVLKPGGYILAFSAARTYHKLATSIEEAGFEIRDQIMWIYSSGFPKSQDVGKSIQRSLDVKETICTDDAAKQWEGWGTSLKPAHEPIVMARKPIKTSIAKNVQKYGTAALNIDACRVGDEIVQGRFPSNVIGEITGYQKFFYCPKVSRKERHAGFDDTDNISTELSMLKDMGGYYIDNNGKETKVNSKNIWLPQTGNIYIHGLKEEYRKWCVEQNKSSMVGNNHPTVKPVELMKYLIKLVTPPNSKVLDPFNGSGSTGMAAVSLGHEYVGLELDQNYVDISLKRIEAYNNKPEELVNLNNTFKEIFEDAT